MSGGDPGREHVVGVIGEVVANEGVEQVMVAVEVRAATATSCRSRVVIACVVARASSSPSLSPEISAAATSKAGASLVRAPARTAATAAWSPLISRRSSVSVSSGMYMSIGAGADAGLTPN
jgi:hypothetical protein